MWLNINSLVRFSEICRWVGFWHGDCSESVRLYFCRTARARMHGRALIHLSLATVAFCYATPALADNVHVCDISQYASCSGADAMRLYGSLPQQVWVFGTANANETLYIAVLTPKSDLSGNFASGGNLWAALGVSPTQNFPNFASTVSQEQLATGMTPLSFGATSFPVNGMPWTGTVTAGQSVTLPNGPIGTIYIAYILDSNGNLVAVSPWSSSMIFVPEPSTVMLLGVGLLALSVLGFRRFVSS